MRGAYDVVIAGGGVAGAALAARLSEDENVRVLLLEAGPDLRPDTAPPALIIAEVMAARMRSLEPATRVPAP